MDLDAIAAELACRGFADADAVDRAALVARACAHLACASQQHARWAWFVPGRVEVFGRHTDYAGGHSLVAAVPRGFAVAAAPRPDRIVRISDAREGRDVSIDPADVSRRYSGWTNYAAVVARRLFADFPGADLGTDIAIISDLPRAAGMSSSSALVVGLALAIGRRAGLEHRPEWRERIASDLDRAAYLGAVENGSPWGGWPGTEGVGTLGGSQDHTAILTCQAGRVSAYRYLPIERCGDEAMPAAWRFVLMTSGIHASKAGKVRDRFNRAPQAVSALLDVWTAAAGERPPSLSALLASNPDASGELLRRSAAGWDAFTGDELRRRLVHFVGEDARVPLATAAFRAGDEQVLSDLARASQQSAEDDLGNQVPETRELARLAASAGAFAASSFGAGFGGSVWALVRGDERECERVALRWLNAYRIVCPHVPPVEWFVTAPAPGAVELPLTVSRAE
jgi:galactokinase